MNAKRTKPKPRTTPDKPGPYRPATERTTTPQGGNGLPANPAERITDAGLIRVANLQAVQSLPLYYCAETGKWYGPSGQGGFSRYKESYAAGLVAEHGFNRRLTDDQGNTPADRALMWLMQNRSVEYAGPLAGYPAGLHELDGRRFLVTETQRIVTPTPGEWPTIRRLIETMLADEKHDQLTVFYLWAAESLAAFYQRMTCAGPWRFRHCPALGLFGPRHCGKTALIDLILTPLLGWKKGDPMTFLKEGRFNKDLFGASLLALDDKGANAGLAERRQRGEAIKDLLWKPEQRMEGKGVDALMLRPFWRMVIAGNDDDAGLQVCPALSPSLDDKLILLRARQADGLPQTKEENDSWADAIRKELPAFASFLLGYRAPSEITLDPRTHVLNFKHPELVSALREMQPEVRLLELIDGLGLIGVDAPLWEGTASEFEKELRGKDKERILDRLFINPTAAGRMLTELARIAPERIKRTSRGGTAYYRVFRKQGLPKDETP
jgi:hypothetical protein